MANEGIGGKTLEAVEYNRAAEYCRADGAVGYNRADGTDHTDPPDPLMAFSVPGVIANQALFAGCGNPLGGGGVASQEWGEGEKGLGRRRPQLWLNTRDINNTPGLYQGRPGQ